MRRPCRSSRPGFTLVEILTATVLMIIIMMAVTVIFASVADSIGQSRATLEMNQRLRSTKTILEQDLNNVTAVMNPPLNPADGQGYFVYKEGPIGPIVEPFEVAWNTDLDMPDSTVGDIDDILMFTATSRGQPYVGLVDGQAAVSNSAEIIWFIRGRTLYRRVLLVKPEIDVRAVHPAGFYANNDLSVRKSWDYECIPPTAPPGPPYNPADGPHRPVLATNSLADLTRPECRFGYQPDMRAWMKVGNKGQQPTPLVANAMSRTNNTELRYWDEVKPYPFFSRPWLGAPFDPDAAGEVRDPVTPGFRWVPGLGMPILAECSAPNWRAGDALPAEHYVGQFNPPGIRPNDETWVQMPELRRASDPTKWIDPMGVYDAWQSPHPWRDVDPATGALMNYSAGTRIGEDVVLTNVASFDVKAWDPQAPLFSVSVPNPVILMPGDPAYVRRVADPGDPSSLQLQVLARRYSTLPGQTPPPTGAYVDLNYMAKVPRMTWDHDLNNATPPIYVYPDNPVLGPAGAPVLDAPHFGREGSWNSIAYGTRPEFAISRQPYDFFPAVYDTWSLHYEYNQQVLNYFSENPSTTDAEVYTIGDEDGDGMFDEATNGFDDDGINGADDVGEREVPPPYPVPLQGIQIRIRTFEPGSRQVREVTIVHKFRTK